MLNAWGFVWPQSLLSTKNVNITFRFVQDHVEHATGKWRLMIVFSDEPRFNFIKNEDPPYVICLTGTRLHKKFIISTVKHGGASIMVSGCFPTSDVGPLGCRVRFIYYVHRYIKQ